jgi:hypothetical protein
MINADWYEQKNELVPSRVDNAAEKHTMAAEYAMPHPLNANIATRFESSQ